MISRWNEVQAAACTDELDLRVYSSQLLGAEPALVLHGGGNTSVKLRQTNLFGEVEDILYVKGSGWDLASIQRPGFTPLRLEYLRRLAGLEQLSDTQMVNELKGQQTLASAPAASVEAILHAILPYTYVDHTHADALLCLSNTPDGEALVRAVFGDLVVVIPYVMPGFDLAREVARRFPKEAGPNCIGMVLMNHGLFSFGADARTSYERMIQLVSMAEDALKARAAWELPRTSATLPTARVDLLELANLRARVSEAAGSPMLMRLWQEPREMAFVARADLASISQQGPATPDHVIRTKRLPMLGQNLDAYAADYRGYFEHNQSRARNPVEMLDPAPRVILDPELGLLTLGKSASDCQILADIYRHSMDIMQRAERLGGWRALSEGDIFDVEYWELEQAKLRHKGSKPLFQGEIALVTGAASGIGRACVQSLLARGAAVMALDLNPAIGQGFSHPNVLGLECDITDQTQLDAALETGVRHFGGLDMLILNAGIFPEARPIAELDDDLWHRVMQVNLDANLRLLRSCHPLLKLAPNQGRVVIIGSRNVAAPGPGAAAYSASKAALSQLMRVAALEWARDGIRLNELHPDAVFDTGIWTPEVLESRARHYGLSLEGYKTRNLLKVEITSRDVAELAAEMCGPLFARTTAAQVPIDGGNDRVI